jgi:hypothetical protein
MIHLSWRYFEQSGDPVGYLLYRELSHYHSSIHPEAVRPEGNGVDREAEHDDSQNDRTGDPGD